MPGAPHSAFTDDFVIIYGPAVLTLGDYNTAGVFQRIAFRCEKTGSWHVTLAELADDVFLTVKQVRRAVERLREVGWIESSKDGRWLNTLTFRVIWDDEEPRNDRSALQGTGDEPETTEVVSDNMISADPPRDSRSALQGTASAPQGTASALQGASSSALQGRSSFKKEINPLPPLAAPATRSGAPPPPPKHRHRWLADGTCGGGHGCLEHRPTTTNQPALIPFALEDTG